jgi:uncharacterized SAM-binding protein YcdF (DUF218 family)
MLTAPQKERIARATLGAALGFLSAIALAAAELPLFPWSSVSMACVVATILGGIIAVIAPVRWIAAAAALVAVTIFMVGFTPVIASQVHALVRRDSLAAAPPDAVIALSTTISADGLLDQTGTTRLLSALEVMRRTGARELVTTRPIRTPAESMAAAMQDYRRLIGLAGDTSRWRVVGPVATTHDEALATSRLLAPAGAHSIVVVTSPLHTRRACATFEAQGFSVICWPADERRYALYAFSGVRTRIAATADWIYERAAMLEYRWRGWIR